jgi:hypothetical protein
LVRGFVLVDGDMALLDRGLGFAAEGSVVAQGKEFFEAPGYALVGGYL